MDLAIQRQHQRHRVFGNGVRRVLRNPNDTNTEPRCRTKVDVVVAGRSQCHEARPAVMRNLHYLSIDLVVDERADRRVTVGEAGRWTSEPRLEEFDLVPKGDVGGLERLAILAVSVEHSDLHAALLGIAERHPEGEINDLVDETTKRSNSLDIGMVWQT